MDDGEVADRRDEGDCFLQAFFVSKGKIPLEPASVAHEERPAAYGFLFSHP